MTERGDFNFWFQWSSLKICWNVAWKRPTLRCWALATSSYRASSLPCCYASTTALRGGPTSTSMWPSPLTLWAWWPPSWSCTSTATPNRRCSTWCRPVWARPSSLPWSAATSRNSSGIYFAGLNQPLNEWLNSGWRKNGTKENTKYWVAAFSKCYS